MTAGLLDAPGEGRAVRTGQRHPLGVIFQGAV
jgi:hypothetical protein